MNRTNIQYLDFTWNITSGCSKISPGCAHCWAERTAKGRLRGRFGYDQADPFKPTFHPERLHEPLKARKSSRIGVSFMGDLFHEGIDDDWISRIFYIMEWSSHHTYFILTKRPQRMKEFLQKYDEWDASTMSHIWLGVTSENQEMADLRIPILLSIPAAVHFVSIEPALGYINLRRIKIKPISPTFINLVIIGGETGPGARPMDPDWARAVRDQCREANVPFFFKTMGSAWKGETPPDLMIRELPA